MAHRLTLTRRDAFPAALPAVTTSLELTRKTTVRWRIFLLILLIVAINYVDRASLSVAMPAISREFGIDAAAQGVSSVRSSVPIRSCKSREAGLPRGTAAHV